VQHDIGRLEAQQAAPPDGVAQIIFHAFAGGKDRQVRLHAQGCGQGPAQISIDALDLAAFFPRPWRIVLIDRHAQHAVGLDLGQGCCLDSAGQNHGGAKAGQHGAAGHRHGLFLVHGFEPGAIAQPAFCPRISPIGGM
jgi:hypothetical protein